MSLQICRHLCSLWFLLSWRIILSCRVIWSYCLMCIISNADQSLRNVPTNWNIVDFFCSFWTGASSDLFLIWSMCLIWPAASGRVVSSLPYVRSLPYVFACRRWENTSFTCEFSVLASIRLCATTCCLFLSVRSSLCQCSSKGQKLTDKNLYEEVYLYCLIVHLFCSGVLLGVTIKSVFKAPASPCGFLLSHLFTTSQAEGLL